MRGEKKYSRIPRLVEVNAVVRQISCGALHTAIVTDSGAVYTWGDGRGGQLGLSSESFTIQPTPVLVEALASTFITQVSCGRSHTLALSDKGHLYSWGNSKFGQTGQGDRQMVKVPRRIDTQGLRPFVKIESGEKHNFAINSEGVAYSWGCNEHGQIGQGKEVDILKPTVVPGLDDVLIRDISCGTIHSGLLSVKGEVYVCGFGEYFLSQDTQHFFVTPRLIPTKEPMKQLACGQSHILTLGESGNVYAWGAGEYGQIGHGVKGNIAAPRLILKDKNIAQVSAGRYHSFALTDFGVMYSWGCGENGQLGQDSDENISLPKVVEAVSGVVTGQVSCGEHHTAALTSAPWSKVTSDMNDWLKLARETYGISARYVKQSNRGLSTKDQAKIDEEVNEWKVKYAENKRAQKQAEQKEALVDIRSIHAQEILMRDVQNMLKNRKEVQPEKTLPTVGDEVSSEEKPVNENTSASSTPAASTEEKEKSASSKTTTQLPKLAKKKTVQDKPSLNAILSPRASSGSSSKSEQRSGAKTARLPDVHNRRSSKNGGSTERSSSANGGKGAGGAVSPLARTSFLKDAVSRLRDMKKVVAKRGKTEQKQQSRQLQEVVFSMRKEYDALQHRSGKMAEDLKTLKKEHELLCGSTRAMKKSTSQCNDRLHSLETQLDTVTIKITETEENRKNYELNIAHLKEEEFEHFNELEDLRKQVSDINQFFKKMNELKIQAYEEKDKAEQELQTFQKEISGYKEFVNVTTERFAAMLDDSKDESKTRAQKKEIQKSNEQTKKDAKVAQLEAVAAEKEREAKELAEESAALENKLHHYEKRFQQITAATGLSDPDAIINKFFFKGEIKEQLQMEIDEKQRQLKEMAVEKDKLEKELESARDDFRDQRWRDVDHLEESSREVTTRAKKAQGDSDRVTQRVVFVQEGIANLIAVINRNRNVVGSEPECDSLWSVKTAEERLSALEKAIDELNSDVSDNKTTGSAPKHASQSSTLESKSRENETKVNESEKVEDAPEGDAPDSKQASIPGKGEAADVQDTYSDEAKQQEEPVHQSPPVEA